LLGKLNISIPPQSAERVASNGMVLRNAWFGYGEQNVLGGTEIKLKKGETAVVTGANGSGKSTLLYVCAGLLPLDRGSVELGGHPVHAKKPGELFRQGVRCGVVFQEGGLMSNMNTLANVALPLRYHADIFGIQLSEVENLAKEALERVRIREADYYTLPAHLSFGVRKRLALARALALRPNFFFFDDPDVGLDPDTAKLVHEILCNFRDDEDVTMLVATNRDLLIDRLAVRGLTLQNGKVYERQSARIA
jgi:phospholipid/cholesterol/gamma-HCH transport system ATP-binding protein